MTRIAHRSGWFFAVALLLGAATVAFAQLGGGVQKTIVIHQPVVLEYTHQEVQANLLVETLTALGKEKWEVFQVLPVYKFENQNGQNELIPQRYQIFGRRAAEAK